MNNPILVSVGLIIAESKILICRRPESKRLGGYWEFPGGKLESDENPRSALKREIREELDVEVEVGNPYEVIYHTYDFGTVLVMVFLCQIIGGRPVLREHQEIRWVSGEELADYQFLPADKALIKRLQKEMPILFR